MLERLLAIDRSPLPWALVILEVICDQTTRNIETTFTLASKIAMQTRCIHSRTAEPLFTPG